MRAASGFGRLVSRYGWVSGLFVLLALREKELALDWPASVARARALARRLPAALEGERVLRLVDAVLPDPDGVSLQATAEHRRRNLPILGRISDEVAWLAGSGYSPAARSYVALALECSNGRRPAARPRRARVGSSKAPRASAGRPSGRAVKL